MQITLPTRADLQAELARPEQLTLAAYELQYLTTTTPENFQGSELPVVQVLVDETTTYSEIKAKLLAHVATCHLTDLDTKLFRAAVVTFANDRFEPVKHLVPPQLQGVGSMAEDEDWDLYMYFTLKEIHECQNTQPTT